MQAADHNPLTLDNLRVLIGDKSRAIFVDLERRLTDASLRVAGHLDEDREELAPRMFVVDGRLGEACNAVGESRSDGSLSLSGEGTEKVAANKGEGIIAKGRDGRR
jgi:hypothetical protein